MRAADYFDGKGGAGQSGVNITVQGFDELAAAFKELPNYVNKERNIKAAQKKSAKVYMQAVQGLALTKGGSKRLGQNFKWKSFKSRGKWIDSVYGPDHKTGTEDITWAGLGGILEGGTKERRGGRGRVEPREFIITAWNRTKGFIDRSYKEEMKKMMERAVRKAGLKKVYKKS